MALTTHQIQAIKDKGANLQFRQPVVPCGKCAECLKRRVQGWTFRLEKEAELHSSAFFVTLTYANPPLTMNGLETINKRDLQLFFKKLRKAKQKIKYYACGEYGGHTTRPHYHLIIFGTTAEMIMEKWEHGHVHFGHAETASITYTLKYMCKPKTIPEHEEDDRQQEFALMSKKMGINYLTVQMLDWHHADLQNRCYINSYQHKIAMPRYYKDKIYSLLDKQIIAVHINNQIEQKLVDISDLKKHQKWKQADLIRIHKAKSTKQKRLTPTI